MIAFVIITICFAILGEAIPLPRQEFPLGLIYPGLQQMHQSIPYRSQPEVYQYPIPVRFSPNQYVYNSDLNGPAFRQSTSFPGSLISALPFLPIEVNVPEIIAAIIRGIQSIFGGNSPIFQQATIPNVAVVPINQDSITPIGMMQKNMAFGQSVPIPIIILVPYKQQLEENLAEEKQL